MISGKARMPMNVWWRRNCCQEKREFPTIKSECSHMRNQIWNTFASKPIKVANMVAGQKGFPLLLSTELNDERRADRKWMGLRARPGIVSVGGVRRGVGVWVDLLMAMATSYQRANRGKKGNSLCVCVCVCKYGRKHMQGCLRGQHKKISSVIGRNKWVNALILKLAEQLASCCIFVLSSKLFYLFLILFLL